VGSLLVGIALGAAVGAVAALLYAPKPGKETRDDLVERLDEVKANIEETARAFSESAKTKIAETRSDLEIWNKRWPPAAPPPNRARTSYASKPGSKTSCELLVTSCWLCGTAGSVHLLSNQITRRHQRINSKLET
jgi:hypothetical protein